MPLAGAPSAVELIHVDLALGDVSQLALIHGLGSSRHAWEPILPLLANHGLRATPIELPGYGEHARRAPAHTIDEMAAAVEHEIADLGDDTIVVGHSMGGLVATALAERRPAWLRGLALINATLSVESRLTAHRGSEGLIRRPIIGRIAWRLAPRSKLRSGLESAVAPGFLVPDVFVDDLRACSWSTFTRSTAAVDRYLSKHPLAARLAAVEIRTTLIFGTRDLRLDPAAIASIRDERPDSVVEIAGAGHTPMWETPQEAVEAIARFATSLDTDAVAPPDGSSYSP